jgi:hypothetical protein
LKVEWVTEKLAQISPRKLGAGHVQQHSPESGQVQCLGLTRVTTDRLNMSGLGAGYVRFHFLEPRTGAG